jgi:GWxTD domain-containing protein
LRTGMKYMRNMCRNRYLAVLVALLWSLPAIIAAQEIVPDKIGIQAGILIYGNPSTGPESYVEFPFVINRNQLLFLPEDSSGQGMRAAVFAEIMISDTLGRHVDSTNTYFYSRAADSAAARSNNIRLFNKLFLLLPPGVYKGRLDVIDVSSKKEGSFLYDRIEILPVSTKLALSNLELAYDIKVLEEGQQPSNPRLVKNQREIIPSPMGIFSLDDTVIYAYAELYNIPYDSAMKDNFLINYRVYRSDGSLHFDFGDIVDEKPGSSAVITNILNISGWPAGKYDIELTASDLKSGAKTVASRGFIIFPRAGTVPGVAGAAVKNPLDTVSAATISNVLKFLLSAQQAAVFNSLNDTGKVRFAIQFFKDKDPSPGTPTNEYLIDAFRRYAYANQYFSSLPGMNDGWRSDRGRVLMQYGQWDDRNEITAPSYEHPWERWYYRSIQGGVLFIFVDINGYGEYRLVHSTAKGEIFDSNWDSRVKDENLEIY